MKQTQIYKNAYTGPQRVRRFLRFDICHRIRRMHEVIAENGLDMEGKRVLDVGFGGGDMLVSFPTSCSLVGAEISASAVERAQQDPRYEPFADAEFVLVPENNGESLPDGPFDVVISSHTLEHVPSDEAHLREIHRRLAAGGLFFLFVPIEKPGYNPDHVRTFSVESVTEKVREAGFEIVHSEGNNHMNGHVWKLITIPSRRRWPVLGALANGLRLWTLSPIPYPVFNAGNRLLARLGAGPRQAFVVGRKR